MSPDLKRKYETKVDKFKVATFEVGDNPRDIGDKTLARGTVTGKSGTVVSAIAQMVPNPTLTVVYQTRVPADAVKVVSITTVFETSLA